MNSLNNNKMTNREKTRRPKVIGTLVTKEHRHSEKITAAKSPDPKPFSRWLGFHSEYQQKTLLMIKFMSPLRNFMDRIHVVSANKILKENVRNAFRSDHFRFKIDCRKIIFSKGNLPIALRMSVSSAMSGKLIFSWTDNSGSLRALPTDRLFVAIFNRESKTWVFNIDANSRFACHYSMEAGRFLGKPVQVYAGFVSLDYKRISTSLFLGEVRVL
jgi:Family of unknown function (DUF6266)